MQVNLLCILLSFVIGIFITFHIRSYDIYKKEPFYKLFIVTIWGGVWSTGVSLFFYIILRHYQVNVERDFISAFFIIGPVEEAAKFLALLSSYWIIRKDFDEPTDGLIYMSCVSLGFSLIENYFYSAYNRYPEQLLIIRTLITTPAHIYFSVFMGVSAYSLIREKTGIFFLLASYLYASFMHGLYDSIAFHGGSLILIGLFMWIAKSKLESLLTYTTSISPLRKSLSDFINSYDTTNLEIGIECLNCKSKNKKETYSLGKIFFQKCDQCPSYVLSKENIFRIFRYFGSTFSDLSNHYWDAEFYKLQYSKLYNGNYINDQKKIGFFFLNELNDAINDFRTKTIEEYEQRWWFQRKLSFNNNKHTWHHAPLILTIFSFSIFVTTIYHLIDDHDSFWGLIIFSWPFLIMLFVLVYRFLCYLKKGMDNRKQK